MLLFITVMILSLLIAVVPYLVKMLPIAQFVRKRSEKYMAGLEQQLNVAKEDLEKIREKGTTEEFSSKIKLLRAEEAVQNIEKKMRSERNVTFLRLAAAETFAVWSTKALVSLVLLVISFKNRYTPVMIFDEKLNFQPLTGLLSFPTGVSNAISMPIWILSCNVTIHFVKRLLTQKTTKKTKEN